MARDITTDDKLDNFIVRINRKIDRMAYHGESFSLEELRDFRDELNTINESLHDACLSQEDVEQADREGHEAARDEIIEIIKKLEYT